MANKIDYELLEDQIRGLLYGNAIGDAIGLLTEFMVKKEAKTYYGDKGDLEYSMKVPDFHRERWKIGDWTDDTDQMILIMQSILDKDGEVSPVDFALKLFAWARHGFPELGDFGGMGIGSTTSAVLTHDKFKTDPHFASLDIWEKTGKFVAPNGAVMRTSVLGAYQYNDLEKVQYNTLQICKVTHADPRCQASTVAMTTAISLMLKREGRHCRNDGSLNIELITKEAYNRAKSLIENRKQRKEFKKHMFASKLVTLDLSENEKIGYTLKCVGAGFWALHQSNFRDALQKLTMEAGDADTNGAVAGALLGCKLGAKNLPQSWLDGLLHKSWLDNIIDRFLPMVIPDYQRKFTENEKAE